MREVIFLSKFCFPLAVLLGLPPFCVDLCSFSVCTFLSCLSHSYFLHSKKIKVPNSSRLDPYSNDITLAIYPPPHTHTHIAANILISGTAEFESGQKGIKSVQTCLIYLF